MTGVAAESGMSGGLWGWRWAAALLLPLLLHLWGRWGRPLWRQRRRIVECGNALPGPKAWPIIGNILDMGFDMNELFQKFVNLWRTHGNVFRIWMGPHLLVIIADPRDVEVLLTSTQLIDKSMFYYFLRPWLGTGLLTSTGQKWHKHRKILTPTFHFKILENFVDIFNKHGDILVAKLEEKVGPRPFDISHFIDLYSEDIICESAMGIELNSQTNESKASEYLSAVKKESDIFISRTSKPWLYFDTIYEWSFVGREEIENLKILHGMTNQVILNRKKALAENQKTVKEDFVDELGRKRRLAFLDLLLISAQNGSVLSDEDIREEVDTFMFEGHDTTSSAICFALYELSRNLPVQEKIYEELCEIFTDDKMVLSLDSCNKMKYAEMVIKETLRLHPSVPEFSRCLKEEMRLATRNDVIPPGTNVLVSPFATHRNPEHFANPEEFDPDHFLPDAVQKRHPFAFIPFSAGPRNCIGQKFAMLELKSAIAKIIWNFVLEPSPNYTPNIIAGLTLKTDNGIELKVTRRKKY